MIKALPIRQVSLNGVSQLSVVHNQIQIVIPVTVTSLEKRGFVRPQRTPLLTPLDYLRLVHLKTGHFGEKN